MVESAETGQVALSIASISSTPLRVIRESIGLPLDSRDVLKAPTNDK
jgi:hypothetical protein